jgi:hypothetical protein
MVIVILTTFASVSPVAAESGIDRLEALASHLRSQPVWQARYVQEYVSAGMDPGLDGGVVTEEYGSTETGPADEEKGVVFIGWPDKARFDTGSPAVRRMGLDGRVVRLVDLEAESCDEHVLSEDEWRRIPLAAVLEPQRALDHFSVDVKGDDGLLLIPREAGGVSRLEVEIGADGMPSSITIEDSQGSVNRLDFTGWAPAGTPPAGGWLPPVDGGLVCVTDEE